MKPTPILLLAALLILLSSSAFSQFTIGAGVGYNYSVINPGKDVELADGNVGSFIPSVFASHRTGILQYGLSADFISFGTCTKAENYTNADGEVIDQNVKIRDVQNNIVPSAFIGITFGNKLQVTPSVFGGYFIQLSEKYHAPSSLTTTDNVNLDGIKTENFKNSFGTFGGEVKGLYKMGRLNPYLSAKYFRGVGQVEDEFLTPVHLNTFLVSAGIACTLGSID
jgi:hypothetical protein